MRGGLVLIVVVICALLGAQTAEAGTLAKTGGEYSYVEGAAETEANSVALYWCTGGQCASSDPDDFFLIRDTGDSVDVGTSGCAPWAPNPIEFMKCPGAGITSWRLELAGGNDALNLQPCCGPFSVPVTVRGGAGNDNFGFGGPHNDTIEGGPGNDILSGADGNDLIDGGPGADTMEGGPGTDVVSYAGRTEGVTVDVGNGGADDGSASDGPPGSRDTIQNFEVVIGGDGGDDIDGSTVLSALTLEGRGGGDRIRGGIGPNTLRGEGGNDDLEGRGGADVLDGGDGHDTIDGLGGADTLRGGAGFDSIEARDGVADSVDCGEDDDAATTDAADSRVNCDRPAAAPGGSTTVTVIVPSRLLLDFGYGFVATRRTTTFRNLALEVERGARLTATCRTAKRKRCRRTRDLTKAAASASAPLRGFEGKPLPVGAKLELRATKSGMIGVVKTLTIRKRRAPAVKTRCLPPGAATASAC